MVVVTEPILLGIVTVQGEVGNHKGSLAALGKRRFSREHYNKPFSPTLGSASARLKLAGTALEHRKLRHLDLSQLFIQADEHDET